MQETSFFVRAFLWLFAKMEYSAGIIFLKKFFEKIAFYAKNSVTAKVLNKVFSPWMNMEEKYGESSLFYGISSKIIGFVCKVGKKGAAIFSKANESSLNKKLYNSVLKESVTFKMIKPENFVPLLIVLMFSLPHEMWNNMYALAVSAVCAAVCFISFCFSKDAKTKHSYLWLSLVLFIFASGVGVLASFAVSDSIRVFIFFLISFILCITVYLLLSDYEKFSKFVMYMYAAIIITSVYAIYQRIVGVEVSASLTDLTLNKNMPGRVFSTFGNPNNYAEYLMMFLPFCFVRMAQVKKPVLKVLGLASFVLPLSALLFTYSRSGWIAFAIAVFVFILMYNKKLLIPLAIVAVIAVPLLPQSVLNRILTIGNMADSSSSYRFVIWTGTLKMLEKYWFTGIGLGPEAFKLIYPPYALQRAITAPHSHMQFMEILIEMGVIGLISFLAFTVCLVLRSRRAAKITQNKYLRSMCIAAAAAMAGIGFIGLVEYVWFYPRDMFAFFITAGMAMALVRMSKNEKYTEREKI